jgi:predicted outer membrane protein
MNARFQHRLVWIGAAALAGVAACGGGGHEKPTGAAPGGPAPAPGPTPTAACLGPAWFGGLDEAARARVIDLVCADARSGTLSEKRLTGEAGPSCKGSFTVGSDEEIAAVLATLDEGQMRQANLGEANAAVPNVRDFAHQMSTAHARSGEEQRAMMRRVRARHLRESDLNHALTKGFEESQTTLRAARGPGFDREFMSREIIVHARSIELLDALAPQAKNDISATVEKNRDLAQAHLELACTVYATIPAAAPPVMEPTPPAPATPGQAPPAEAPAPIDP